MKNVTFLFFITLCLQLSCSTQPDADAIGIFKNGEAELTVNKKDFLVKWSEELANEPGNPIKTSLRNLTIVKQDNGEFLLTANNANNTIQSAKFIKINGDKVALEDRTCTCMGCEKGCAPVLANNKFICAPECPDSDCTKTVTVKF